MRTANLSAGQSNADMCIASQDLAAEGFKTWVTYISGNSPSIACDRKVSQESNDCRSCCCIAAVNLTQQQPLAHVHDTPAANPRTFHEPSPHALRCRECVKEYFIYEKLCHLLPHDGGQAIEKAAKQALNLRM